MTHSCHHRGFTHFYSCQSTHPECKRPCFLFSHCLRECKLAHPASGRLSQWPDGNAGRHRRAHVAPQKHAQRPLDLRQHPRALAGEGLAAHRTASCTCFTDIYQTDAQVDFTSKICDSWLPGGIGDGLTRKAEAFLAMSKVWPVSTGDS